MSFPLNHFIKHKFSETFGNFKRHRRAVERSKNFKGEERRVSPPEEYREVFVDEFNTPLNAEEWRYGLAWGNFHPQNLHQYYDYDGTLSYTSHQGLVLELRKSPKTYKKSDLPEWLRTPQMPDEFTIPVGVGYVSTKKFWQYGWFEAWIQLPEGQSYWPAFWLTGQNGWPPEIDILEAYSQKGPKYEEKSLLGIGKKVPNQKIQPNLHYGKVEGGTKKDYGAYDVPVASCTERFVQYVCHWERDFIRIYYDGLLILEVTDPKILKEFSGEKDQMYVIFNHGLHQDFPEDPRESAMLVREFKVCQK
jgi:hypothetical protein